MWPTDPRQVEFWGTAIACPEHNLHLPTAPPKKVAPKRQSIVPNSSSRRKDGKGVEPPKEVPKAALDDPVRASRDVTEWDRTKFFCDYVDKYTSPKREFWTLAEKLAAGKVGGNKSSSNEHIEQHQKLFGKRLDHDERKRKRESRAKHKNSEKSQKLRGIKAKLFHKKRYTEKATMKKTLKQHQEKDAKQKEPEEAPKGAVPAFLLDREGVNRTKVLSNMIKQKKKEKAGKWAVPIPKVKAMTEDEMFKILRSGKRKKKAWKRVINKVTYVGDDFTRKAPKYERFIRPSSLRFKKAHVTHPELKTTFHLDIVAVKKNPQSSMFTSLGVITKGTIIEVNVSDLGLVTQTGKVVWAKYAQVTNEPDMDGCINALLLV